MFAVPVSACDYTVYNQNCFKKQFLQAWALFGSKDFGAKTRYYQHIYFETLHIFLARKDVIATKSGCFPSKKPQTKFS